jgi:threonine/homoserine/homoserine lactone efflux protein
MTLESYLLFVVASIVLCVVPGPDLAYLLSRCIAQGKKAGLFAALGINAGSYVHLAAAITGLSAILLTSSVAFTAVKWLGALYLIYLGISALRGGGNSALVFTSQLPGERSWPVFWQGFISDVLNPKVAIFFLALLPQFVEAGASNPISQLILLGITVNVIQLMVNFILISISARVTNGLRRNESVTKWLKRAMGVTFIGLGARLAFEKI